MFTDLNDSFSLINQQLPPYMYCLKYWSDILPSNRLFSSHVYTNQRKEQTAYVNMYIVKRDHTPGWKWKRKEMVTRTCSHITGGWWIDCGWNQNNGRGHQLLRYSVWHISLANRFSHGAIWWLLDTCVNHLYISSAHQILILIPNPDSELDSSTHQSLIHCYKIISCPKSSVRKK